MAFPGDWSKKIELTIDNTLVPGAQVDFPIVVTADSITGAASTDFWANVLNGGGDIRFLDSDDSTKLACEVVDCNTSTENLEVHVKIPSLPSSVDDTIYLYYGNAVASQPSRSSAGDSDGFVGSENVWDANYVAVYHLQTLEDVSGTLDGTNDSTSNANHVGTGAGNTPTETTAGKFGGGMDFDGTESFLALNNGVTHNAPLTSEAWYRNTDTIGDRTVFSCQNSGGQHYWYSLWSNEPGAQSIRSYWGGTSFAQTNDTQAKTVNTWYHTALKREANGANLDQYLRTNGASDGSTINSATAEATDTSARLGIGQLGPITGGFRYFRGQMDEHRYSNTNRSDNWTDTGYNNQNDPASFITGSVASDLGGGAYNPFFKQRVVNW